MKPLTRKEATILTKKPLKVSRCLKRYITKQIKKTALSGEYYIKIYVVTLKEAQAIEIWLNSLGYYVTSEKRICHDEYVVRICWGNDKNKTN